jgi:hypothetical protein
VVRALMRLGAPALFAATLVSCDAKGTDYFLTEVNVGELIGTVASGGSPINGAIVTLTGAANRTATTGTSGAFSFTGLPPGDYDVNTSATNFVCAPASATVAAHLASTANVTCTPQPGSIGGTVLLDLAPRQGVVVVATQGATTVGSATSGSNGTYSIANLPPGVYTVSVTPFAITDCAPEQQSVTVQSNQVATANFACITLPGSVSGTVLVNGSGQAGVSVSLAQGSTTIGTTTTTASGTYSFSNVPPGTYSASITPPANTACTPNPQNVTVQPNQNATANFSCTSLPGSVSGTVLVSGSGQSGVAVTLTQSSNTIGTATTGAGGAYTITNVPPGTYSAAITPPAGTVCANNPQSVTVLANQAATANFTCSIANDFSVSLIDPAPSYRHIVNGVSAETCSGISTNPARPGGSWTTTWTGPGTVGATTRTGVLDATGHAVDRQPINLVGTYNLNVSVVANGLTRTATGSVVVTAAAGTCLP